MKLWVPLDPSSKPAVLKKAIAASGTKKSVQFIEALWPNVSADLCVLAKTLLGEGSEEEVHAQLVKCLRAAHAYLLEKRQDAHQDLENIEQVYLAAYLSGLTEFSRCNGAGRGGVHLSDWTRAILEQSGLDRLGGPAAMSQ